MKKIYNKIFSILKYTQSIKHFNMKKIIFSISLVILMISLVGFVLAEGNVTACTGEGKTYGTYISPTIGGAKCCEGLTSISVSKTTADGLCYTQSDSAMCTKCGNGECGLGENKCNCPKDCPSNITVTPACTDSDGGKDYYVKGITKGSYGNGQKFDVEDSCENNEVHEYYCISNVNDVTKPNYEWINYNCPNGCKDGACVKSSPVCGNGICEEGEKLMICPTCGIGVPCTQGCKMVCSQDCEVKQCKSDNECPSACSTCGSSSGSNYEACMSQCYIGKCIDGTCVQKEQCKIDSDCVQVCPTCGIGVNCPCYPIKCINGLCRTEKTCQPIKCDDGTMTECKKDNNGDCICSTCNTIIIKPVCGNGVCESGEGEVCISPAIAFACEEGKECKMPPSTCNVNCPQDCKISEPIYANLNEKFKLGVYQYAKIMESDNSILKITFKDLIAYKCQGAELSVSESKTIEAKVALVTGNAISETTTTSSGGSGGSVESTSVTSGVSVLKCIGAGPKALLRVDIVSDELGRNNIINLDVGEKKQVEGFTIYFPGYDYASRTGTFLVTRETFSCPIGCKCNEKGETMECSDKKCIEGLTLCPDGKCAKECEMINPEDCKYGCMFDGKCFPMGVRSNGTYCSNNLVMSSQLKSDETCDNNFECSSNVCVSGKCISEGFLKKIMNWFSRMFGGK